MIDEEKEKIFLEAAKKLGISSPKIHFYQWYSPLVEQLNGMYHPEPFKKGEMLIREYRLYEIKRSGPIKTAVHHYSDRYASEFDTSYVRKNYVWVPQTNWQATLKELIRTVNTISYPDLSSDYSRGWSWLPMLVRIYEQCGLLKNESKAISSWIEETDGGVF